MSRWQALIITTVLVVVFIWALVLPPSQPLPTSKTQVPTINNRAPIAANGNPLPAPAREDVILELQELGQGAQGLRLSRDFETKNWQLDYNSGGTNQKLLYAQRRFFIYNLLDGFWDEVDSKIINQTITQLKDVEQFILNDQQIDAFTQASNYVYDETCQSSVCAVWQAEDFESADTVVIRVDKLTRKIYDITIINLASSNHQPITVFYNYQDVDLQLPKNRRKLPQPERGD